MRDAANVERTVETIIATWGHIDIVIANAGYAVTGKFEGIATDQWQGQFDTNVIGVVHTLRSGLPHVEKVDGRLAVISSVMGLAPAFRCAPYCASKHALTGLCRSLQLELKGRSVSLTNIMPGFVESEIRNVDNNGEIQGSRPRAHQKDSFGERKTLRVLCSKQLRRGSASRSLRGMERSLGG